MSPSRDGDAEASWERGFPSDDNDALLLLPSRDDSPFNLRLDEDDNEDEEDLLPGLLPDERCGSASFDLRRSSFDPRRTLDCDAASLWELFCFSELSFLTLS